MPVPGQTGGGPVGVIPPVTLGGPYAQGPYAPGYPGGFQPPGTGAEAGPFIPSSESESESSRIPHSQVLPGPYQQGYPPGPPAPTQLGPGGPMFPTAGPPLQPTAPIVIHDQQPSIFVPSSPSQLTESIRSGSTSPRPIPGPEGQFQQAAPGVVVVNPLPASNRRPLS